MAIFNWLLLHFILAVIFADFKFKSLTGLSETPSYYESRSNHDLSLEEFEMMKERIATLEKLNRQKDDKIK